MTSFRANPTFATVLLTRGTMPRTPEEIIQLLHAWVNGDNSYFGTVPCLIEQDDGPISAILIEAGELELLALIRRLAPQRREERERRLLAEKEARRLIFRDLLWGNRMSESTSTFGDPFEAVTGRFGKESEVWSRKSL
jgi:hypothetical protein